MKSTQALSASIKRKAASRPKQRKAASTTVMLPAARAIVQRAPSTPRIVTTGETVRITHQEVIWSPTRSAALSTTSFIVNPGRSMFTWLKAIAPSFEYYVIDRMSIHFVPNVSFNETGQIALAFDYDPLDDDSLLTMDDIMAMSGSAMSPVWKEFSIAYNNPRTLGKMCTSLENADYDRFSDAGQLIVAYQGNTATDAALIGNLSVSYAISFYRPQPSPRVNDVTVSSVLLNNSLRADQAGSLYKTVSGTLSSLLNTVESTRLALKNAGYTYDPLTGRITVPPGISLELFGEVKSDLATGDTQLLTFTNADQSPVNCVVTPLSSQPPLRSLYTATPVYNAARASVAPTNPTKSMSFIPSMLTLGFNAAALIGTSLSIVRKEL